MKFKYEVDMDKVGVTKEELDKLAKDGSKGIFELFISNLFGTKYPDGVKGRTIRSLDKLLSKLDSAENGHMEIDEGDVELMREVLMDDNITVGTRQVRLYSALRRSLEEAIGNKG